MRNAETTKKTQNNFGLVCGMENCSSNIKGNSVIEKCGVKKKRMNFNDNFEEVDFLWENEKGEGTYSLGRVAALNFVGASIKETPRINPAHNKQKTGRKGTRTSSPWKMFRIVYSDAIEMAAIAVREKKHSQ